jgi:hypothetical protein
VTDEYSHLDHNVLGRFKHRHGEDSILDGYSYCNLDLNEIGKNTRGSPNRCSVAAFMRDPTFLMLHGARDPLPHLKQMTAREKGFANFSVRSDGDSR